jgi:hypothetical protein
MNDIQKTVAGALLIGANLIVGNAALATVAGGVGVTWVSEGVQGIRRQWRTRKLDTPLARAYSTAVHAAVESLRVTYVKTQDGRSPTSAFDLVAACADDLSNAEFPTTQMSVDAAQVQLAGALDQLLHGHDARQADYLKAQLLPMTALALRDALSADGEAWMRFHGRLIEDLRAGQTELSAKFDKVAEVLARFEDVQLARTAMQVTFDLLTDTTSRIDARTLRMENTLNEVADNVRVLLKSSPTSGGGVAFNNQGMTVQGNFYQSAGTMNITNVPRTEGAQTGLRNQPPAEIDKVALRDHLIRRFSRSDLELLCANVQGRLARAGYEVKVSLEMIGGNDSLALQCQNLINYLDRRGFLAILVEEANAMRPGAPFS